MWIALIAAAALEFLLPLLIYGVDWSFLPWFEPPPVPVMTVDLKEPPPPEPPPPPPEKPKQKPKPKQPERLKQVPVEIPKPVPGEVPSKITLAKPEPEPKPEPKKPEPPPPEPEPEVEAPPLPSVFQDVKPVRKAKIKYPPEAEAAAHRGACPGAALGGRRGQRHRRRDPAGRARRACSTQAVLEGVRQYKFKRDGTTYKADQEVIFKIDP